ncbi:MAG: hypothetical protein ABGX16_07930 [Pirellulales bacterium]
MVALDLTFLGPGTSSGGTWDLFGRVEDTGGGADGSFGLTAIRALIDGIDFGVLGNAIFIAPGIGAINPIDEGGPNERVPALQTAGGTIDIIYGQDISDDPSVVGFVGIGSDALIAYGTFLPGSIPDFGDDDSGLLTDALFLNTFPGPFGGAISPDSVSVVFTHTIVPEPSSLVLLVCGGLLLPRRRR